MRLFLPEGYMKNTCDLYKLASFLMIFAYRTSNTYILLKCIDSFDIPWKSDVIIKN